MEGEGIVLDDELDEGVVLDDDIVNGRDLSEGTISTLLAASQFDGQSFCFPLDEVYEKQTVGNLLKCSDFSDGTRKLNCAEHGCNGQSNGFSRLSDETPRNSDGLFSVGDEALKQATREVVRSVKRARESRPASRDVSQEEENVLDVFSQVEIGDCESARSNVEDTSACTQNLVYDEYLPPTEESLKPRLENISIRLEMEPDITGRW